MSVDLTLPHLSPGNTDSTSLKENLTHNVKKIKHDPKDCQDTRTEYFLRYEENSRLPKLEGHEPLNLRVVGLRPTLCTLVMSKDRV